MYFVADLFRTLHRKFCQNQPSFRKIQQKILAYFFISMQFGIITNTTFQVLQDSIETLFRWGGKHLHYFLADLFRTLCRKFYQNQPVFLWEDMTISFWLTSFWDKVYIVDDPVLKHDQVESHVLFNQFEP